MIVAGVDVGNSTTEIAFARLSEGSAPAFLLLLRTATTGAKGSLAAAAGVRDLLGRGAGRLGEPATRILLADLRPVRTGLVRVGREVEVDLGPVAVAVPGSATPAGVGVGAGRLRRLEALTGPPDDDTIVVVVDEDFELAAAGLRDAIARGWPLVGVIARGDDAVLIANRIDRALPIVDEVAGAALLPVDARAAIEVAPAGHRVTHLADPLRLAVLLELDADGGRAARNAARAVSGGRCAIVVRQPSAPAAPAVLAHPVAPIAVLDRFAVPLPLPRDDGALRARLVERRQEGVATLTAGADEDLAGALGALVVCDEPTAALAGAATTPGAGAAPFVLDIGGGTIDLHRAGGFVTLAGAGDLVTWLCAGVLDCPQSLAERAKRGRSIRLETPFVVHHEDGSRTFRSTPAPRGTVGRLCIDETVGPVPLDATLAPEIWGELRRRAKRDVVVANTLRAIERAGGVPRGELVLLVGGCAEDTEVVAEISAGLADLDIAVARGDVLGEHGPRGAVAVGLVLTFAGTLRP